MKIPLKFRTVQFELFKIRRVYQLVEMAGIEPASERDSEKTSTSVAYALMSREQPTTSNLPSRQLL